MGENLKDAESAGMGAYYAYMEDGELVMEPHCRCGNPLDELYYCDQCQHNCRCTDIMCDDQATLNLVEKYIRTSPKLRNFQAILGRRRSTTPE